MRYYNQDTTSATRLSGQPRHVACLTALVACCLASAASATSISFNYTQEFSGATPPSGTAPWLTANFDDEGTPGTVKLTFTATNLTGGEFVSGAYFNLNSAYSAPGDIAFSVPNKTGTFNDPTINVGIDAYKADGDGRYDIRINFASGPPSARFGAGDAVVYTITGTGAAAGVLVATDFKFLSAPDGGHGPFYVAAHVQGIGEEGDDSGWVTTPEPASWLLALGCALFGVSRRVRD